MKAKKILTAILVISNLCGLSLAEWSEPVPVTEVNSEYAEWTPFLSFDGLSLYFARGHGPAFYDFRIFEATRPVPYGPFTSVGEISGTLNSSPGNVMSPWVSPDNLRMYYFTESNLVYKLKVTERMSDNDPWPVGKNIPGLDALGGRPQAPSLTADELIIVFSSYNAPGGVGGFDLWMATRPDKYSSFGNVRNLTEINTAYKESKPYISPDGLTLYFPTDRNGSGQLFRATRASLTLPFGNLEHLSFFDVPRGGGHPSLSSDGTALYMAKTISGIEDIYVSYLDTGPEPGPIAHWMFDEGSGSVAYDSAGNNDGTIYGAQWTTGQVDGALSFDGVDDYVDIPYDSSLDINTQTGISLSVWINFNSYPDGFHQGPVFGLFNSAGQGVKNYLFIGKSIYGNPIKWIQWPSPSGAIISIKPDLDTWYHVVAVEDSPYRAIYINGSLDSSDHLSQSYTGNPPDTIRIGSRADAWAPYYFDGSIDDVRIYNRALSAEEIWDIYVPHPTEPLVIDIKPGNCPNPLNVKSRGVLPVAILGSEDFDVYSIDIASIRLAGVAPIRSSYEDVATPVSEANECECSMEGPDGFLDLTLKFETQSVVEVLGEVDHGDGLVLELTGVLLDETLIQGSDCVIIRGRHKPLNRADFNGDGIVGMADFAAFAENWLQLR